jgi:RNA polymerase sigma factor (sigma-70 family)
MSASGDALLATPVLAYAPSAYADQMPKLREFATPASTDPRRGVLREELILAFLPVVEHLARRHAGGHGSVEELTQVGVVGLITAIDRWDPGLACGEFLGYLIPCVHGEMLRWFRDRTWSTRVPRRMKDLSVAIGRASGPLSQELGRAPRPSELAGYLRAPVEEVIGTRRPTGKRARWMRSIRTPATRRSRASAISTRSWNASSTATPCAHCWKSCPNASA